MPALGQGQPDTLSAPLPDAFTFDAARQRQLSQRIVAPVFASHIFIDESFSRADTPLIFFADFLLRAPLPAISLSFLFTTEYFRIYCIDIDNVFRIASIF